MMDFISDEMWRLLSKQDDVGCLGRFNSQSRLCTRKCPLAMRCIIEYNRKLDMMETDDLFGFQDSDAANTH